jgi:hypothetical protein
LDEILVDAHEKGVEVYEGLWKRPLFPKRLSGGALDLQTSLPESDCNNTRP